MELYTKSVETVYFEAPTEDTVVTSAKYSLNGGALINLIADTDDAGKSFVKLPYLPAEGDLALRWSFIVPGSGNFTDTQHHTVVTPYLTKSEVKQVWPEATDAEAKEVESAVRHVINAMTGQSFGYFEGTIDVEGHGETALRLPRRLIELVGLSTLTATLNVNRSIITSDGWYLKKGWTNAVTVLSTNDEYFTGTDVYNDVEPGEPGYEKPDHGPIIVAPGVSSSPTPWRDDYPFSVNGKWGYISVPEPVKEAARLLVNDYACSEALYRDRYLESIKAADWRLQFSSRAWESTGNARADFLLSEFVLLDWAVV
jgi:hypothetical protein